jgi:predicted dehydrogenase
MEKIKVSVVGTGHLGSIHVKLWQEIENIEFVGIFDTDKEQLDKLCKLYNCKGFETVEELIEASDAVTIAAPTSFHAELAMKCIHAGVHCFIEKPITAKYQEAIDLISAAKDKNLVIQVGHVERFNPALAAIKKFDPNPLFIEAHRLSQFTPRATDVSVIHDLMIHDIDIVLSLVKSKVKSIDANGVNVLTETPDIANARINFENGAVANITASRISANPMRKMRFFQKNAYISVDFGNQVAEVFRLVDEGEPGTGISASMLGMIEEGVKGKKIVFEKPEITKINAILEEQKAFIDAITNKSPVAVSAEEATEALRIAEEINDFIK